MNFNRGDLLTLSDKRKYAVVETKNLNEKNYIYLIDMDDYTNVRFVEYNGDTKLVEVNDMNLIKELMELFTKKD